MPTANVSNPDANFSGRRTTHRQTGKVQYPSKSQGINIGGGFIPNQVNAEIDVRYKKKRPARGRKAARGRSALTIQLDSEKPMPRF